MTNLCDLRSPSLLQPVVLWSGCDISCWRVAHCCRQHQHVYLRDRPGLHPDGARGAEEDEGDHRVQGRGQHPVSRGQHQQHVRSDDCSSQTVSSAQEVRDESYQGSADDVHQQPPPLLYQGRSLGHWSGSGQLCPGGLWWEVSQWLLPSYKNHFHPKKQKFLSIEDYIIISDT